MYSLEKRLYHSYLRSRPSQFIVVNVLCQFTERLKLGVFSVTQQIICVCKKPNNGSMTYG